VIVGVQKKEKKKKKKKNDATPHSHRGGLYIFIYGLLLLLWFCSL